MQSGPLPLPPGRPGLPTRRLRLGDKRRGEEAANQGAEERPPIHYSIPSSARCRSDGGIVRPRALAAGVLDAKITSTRRPHQVSREGGSRWMATYRSTVG